MVLDTSPYTWYVWAMVVANSDLFYDVISRKIYANRDCDPYDQ